MLVFGGPESLMSSDAATSGKHHYNIEPIEKTASRHRVIPTSNLALAALSRADLIKIIDSSKAQELRAHEVLYKNGDEIDYLYFPIDSVVSTIAILGDGSEVETSMTGCEGVVGVGALIGGDRALHWTRVLVGGNAIRIPTSILQELFIKNDSINDAILRAYRQLFSQTSQRSVCNARHTLLQKLATWLLMVSDRIGSKTLPFTQEQIANHISVRRAGISVAASMLHDMRAISYHRGQVMITDRLAVEFTACECYEILRRPFRETASLRLVT